MDDDGFQTKKDFDLEVVYQEFRDCLAEDGTITLLGYLNAFSELSRLFKLAGRLFRLVARDLDCKISILRRHMSSEGDGHRYVTIQSMLEYELARNTARKKGSFPAGSRTLHRLQRALEFTIDFLNELARSDDQTQVRSIAYAVYRRTLYKHQPGPVRRMAKVIMYLLPKRKRLIEVMCKQKPDEVQVLFEQVIQVATPVYDNIQELYRINDLSEIP